MCEVDWGLVAAWVSAISAFGLLIAALLGFRVWKTQFIKQRDHDLAMKILRTANNAYAKLDEMRSPTGQITDGDVPVPPSEFDDGETDRGYRVIWARYRARTMHLAEAVDERIVAMNEALAVWDDYGITIGDLINRLSTKESAVLREARVYVDSLFQGPHGDAEYPNHDILYAPADYETNDAFADEYEGIIEEIRVHLDPKIRMD